MREVVVPTVPSQSRLFGNLFEFKRDPLRFLERCARDYGDFVRLRFAHRQAFLLSHPDLIEQALVGRARSFGKTASSRDVGGIFGNGLFTSEGETWRRQRRIMQPAFNRQRLSAAADTIVSLAERHIGRWGNGDIRDMHSEMTELALNTAAGTLLGHELEGSAAAELSGAMRVIVGRFREEFPAPTILSMFLPDLIPTPSRRRLKRAIGAIDAVVGRVIEAARAQPLTGGDAMSLLLNARGASELDERGLRDQVVTLLLTSHETTACALAWVWYLLAEHEAAAHRLETELDNALQGHPPQFDDLPRLSFTRQVILEAMRLYPPGWGMNRRAIQDCEIGGQRIERGVHVAMSQWVVHRDPRFYDGAEQFRPERWSEDFIRGLPKFAYFPFGGGPRLCIGRDLAMLEMTLIVATIARRFRFRPGPMPLQGIEASISLRPAGPMLLRVAARSPHDDRTAGPARRQMLA